MRVLFICMLSSLLMAEKTTAQLNETDTFVFRLRSTVTGNYQKGNVDVLTVKSRIEFIGSPVKHIVIKSQNNGLYQEFSSRKADNDLFSRNYFYYKPQQATYPFAIAYVSGNYRRNINSRIFAGAGVTRQLLQLQHHVLKISASVLYEASRFNGNIFNDAKYNGDNHIDLWRGTLYLAGWHYLAANKLKLYYDAYWQPGFKDPGNYRTQIDMGIDLPLYKGLSFTSLYSFSHENVVISRVKKDDSIITFGITYTYTNKTRRQ